MSQTTVTQRRTLVLAVTAGLMLIIANSAIWFSRTIFNTDRFTSLATGALQSESSRIAIATGIVDKALEKRPAIRGAVDDRAVKLISSLLDTSQVQAAEDKSIRFLQTTITSSNPQPVALELTGTKQVISRIVEAIDARTDRSDNEQRLNPEDIPDEITLFDPSKLPNIYMLGMILLWVGPLAQVLALVIFTYLIYHARHNRQRLRNVLLVITGVLVVVGLIALLVGPLFRPPVLAQAPGPNLRILIANFYDAFLASFTRQTNLMFIGAMLFGTGALWLQLRPLYDKNKVKTRPEKATSASRKRK